MSIHDDAEQARRSVYDAALAERDSIIEGVRGQVDTLAMQLTTATSQVTIRTGERDAALAQVARLQARITELESAVPPAPVDDPRAPKSLAGEAEIRALFGIPASVPVTIVPATETRDLYAIRKAIPKGVLVLPERDAVWAVDTSKGFAASGVSAVDGPNGTKTPVVSNLPLWFEMMRIGDGIVGMGPGTKVNLGASAFSAPPQPDTMHTYSAAGAKGTTPLSGTQYTVMGAWASETSTGTVWYGNFTDAGRDLGGCAYNLLRASGGKAVVRRVAVDGGWRGFKGEPNGEAGALTFGSGAEYDIDGALLTSVDGSSPLMFNSAPRGSVRNVKTTRPNYGMPTWWRCTGAHKLERVEFNGRQVGVNNEQPAAGMSIDFVSGQINLPSKGDGGLYHYTGSSPSGSTKVHFGKDFKATGGAVEGKICVNQYLAPGAKPMQRKSDITSDGQEIVYFGSWAD